MSIPRKQGENSDRNIRIQTNVEDETRHLNPRPSGVQSLGTLARRMEGYISFK
jgi:hypothetical protein